jgi:UDP-glucose 4-epimerase
MILVIGNGYIASRIIKEIVHLGVTVLSDSAKVHEHGVRYHLGISENIAPEFVSQFKTVIFFHGRCNKKSPETLVCNINVFTKLISVMTSDQVLIYTSSSTVYHNNKDYPNKETDPVSLDNYYDISKYTMDSIAKVSGLHYYSLRIGTTCGNSPMLRNDLMINSMLYNLNQNGYIQVSNEHTHRPILGFKDLVRVIMVILESGVKQTSGVYNIASFNSSIMGIAKGITVADNIKIVDEGYFGKELYNFSIDTSKFEKTFDFTFSDNVASIIEDYQTVIH